MVPIVEDRSTFQTLTKTLIVDAFFPKVSSDQIGPVAIKAMVGILAVLSFDRLRPLLYEKCPLYAKLWDWVHASDIPREKQDVIKAVEKVSGNLALKHLFNFFSVVVIPRFEEQLFRGWMYAAMEKRGANLNPTLLKILLLVGNSALFGANH